VIYKYVAVSPAGNVVTEHVEFHHLEEVEAHVSQLGLELVEAEPAIFRSFFAQTRNTKIRETALVDFFQYMSGLMGMGMDVKAATQTAAASLDDKLTVKGLEEICIQLEKGYALSEAMTDTKMFPSLALASIQAGEISGQLERVFKDLTEHYRDQHELKTAAKKAAMYPMISLMVLLTIGCMILIFVVPTLRDIFPKNPPLPTRIMLVMSELVIEAWWIAPLALIGAFVGWRRTPASFKTEVTRRFFHLPVIGPMVKHLTLANLFMNLSMLMAGGVTLVDALNMVSTGESARLLSFKLRQVRNMVMTGQSLAEAFSDPFFPAIVPKAIRQGESTGRLEEYCGQIARFLKDRFHTRVSVISTFIEPVIIVLGGGLVLLLAMAIFLPIYQQLQHIR